MTHTRGRTGHVAKERPIVSTSVIEDPTLDAADRCDRCGAQAYVRVTLATGSELLFCAHHGKQHADKLKQVALQIHDESERLK
ncbi:DUF7455 domain-containing protein [Microlunatus parietis]|uniref:DUF7455 domain-containing protein n=1 Tax=Microlunatus parietis TaxID=682979 RepID=UPI0015CBAAD5|nr:hypothetical protein [Microlunatus parietis]